MFEEKLIVGVASACSTLAIVACLITIPQLYNTINEVHDEVSRSYWLVRVNSVKIFCCLLYTNFSSINIGPLACFEKV